MRQRTDLSEVHIRSCRPGEIEEVLGVWRRADTAPSVTDDTSGLRQLLDHDPGALLVAEADEHIVGTLIATWDGWRANMYRLAVEPPYRRRGIARLLARAGEQRLRARGARRFSALVLADETDATGLWAAVDYEADPRIVRFVRNG